MQPVPLNRYCALFALATIGCALDLVTKSWAFAHLGMPGERASLWLSQGVFGFTTSLNEGSLFSIGQGCTPLFAALSVVTAVGILVWMFYGGGAHSWLLTISAGCILAGALGNLFDRCGLHGLVWNYPNALHALGDPVYAVRDWIDFRLINWPIFNLADSLIVCGTSLLAWKVFTEKDEQAGEERKPALCKSRPVKQLAVRQ